LPHDRESNLTVNVLLRELEAFSGIVIFATNLAANFHVRLPEDAVLETAFRDALRAHAALARDYEALKRDLALRFRYDRNGYTEQKTQFIQEALGK
jgi:GrpB-like predicted nucleotidyltransferase (UPF0157 family)